MANIALGTQGFQVGGHRVARVASSVSQRGIANTAHALGLSQDDVVTACVVAASTYNRWEAWLDWAHHVERRVPGELIGDPPPAPKPEFDDPRFETGTLF